MTAGPTLAVDIGGTGIKLMLLADSGEPLTPVRYIKTPGARSPEAILSAIAACAEELKYLGGKASGSHSYVRASAGFPGVVVEGVTLNAPNLDSSLFEGFPFGKRLSLALGCPVRVVNDADLQGLGVVTGEAVELVLTFGTGLGSALFLDGKLAPNLELGHHPYIGGGTYEDCVSDRALKEVGPDVWTERVFEVVETLRALFSMRTLHLGGGNLRHLVRFPDKAVPFELSESLRGAVRLWSL